MIDICEQIPDAVSDQHGYHRDCYAHFTSNLDRLKDCEPEPHASKKRDARRSSEDRDGYTFKPDCIFCGNEGRKRIKVHKTWTIEGTKLFDRGGGEAIKTDARNKRDYALLRRIEGFDLYCCKAKYHPSCRKRYMMQKPE